jgi:hypothetical protein
MIFRDTPGAPYYPIGTVWVPSGHVKRTFETASWYEEISYAGQTTVLWSNGYYVKWVVSGYVVGSYFGMYGAQTEPGTIREHAFCPYLFSWVAEMLKPDNSYIRQGYEVKLLDEYRLDSAPYKHDPANTGHFITMPNNGHPLSVARQGKGFADSHTYSVAWRGERQDDVIVKRSDGFNGDTYNEAIKRAAMALDLIATH